MSDNHGLSVHTTGDKLPGADTADNRRLHRPVPVPEIVPNPLPRVDRPQDAVTNTFNDATEGEYYTHRSGHEGIDFKSVVGTEVRAMYGGVVFETQDDHDDYGKLVRIRSCTNPNDGTGFEHSYAHLDHVGVEKGDSIRKGEVIGRSGKTGPPGLRAHLHVHLKAFGRNGIVTSENIPDTGTDSSKPEVTEVARRIRGCMNFACFLPPDDSELPAIDGTALRPTGKLLSPRANQAAIPVYSDRSSSSHQLGTIFGPYLGCHAVLEEYSAAGSTEPDWYRIQFGEGASGRGWVSRTGTVDDGEEHVVQWVQVEDAPDTLPEVSANPHFVTTINSVVNIRAYPSLAASIREKVDPNKCHVVVGYWAGGQTEHHWWKIKYGTDEHDVGWVRGDVVEKYGDEVGVPEYMGEDPNNLRAPTETPIIIPPPTVLQPDIPDEETLTLRWIAPAVEGIDGYQIRGHHVPGPLVTVEADTGSADTEWTSKGRLPCYDHLFYRVAAIRGLKSASGQTS